MAATSAMRANIFQALNASVGSAIVLPAGAAAAFLPLKGDGKPYFHYFASPSSDAKFLVGAWNNARGQSPEGLKRWLIENVGGYDETTYQPKGRSWFLLSGYRGEEG